MKLSTKIWLFAAVLFILIGAILFTAVMAHHQWDFAKLDTSRFETNTHEIAKPFANIAINADTADITFMASNGETCKVECYEEENAKHSVAVEGETLTIKVDKKAWYEYIGINFKSPKLIIHLPKTQYANLLIQENTGDIELPRSFKFETATIASSTGEVRFSASASALIKIETSTGGIHLENLSAGAIDLSASTGKITASHITCGDLKTEVSTGETELSHISCKNLISNGRTGDLLLKTVVAEGKITIERDTGDIRFDCSDGAEIFIETDTGDVRGTLLSEKIFITKTDTGRIDLPSSVRGGKCEIHTDTGDIKLAIK